MSGAAIGLPLVVDSGSFAHRAYHALPKTIRRKDDKPADALVGFTNFLLRLYGVELPRAVLVGWDTLDAPTSLAVYQSGRDIDLELRQQLEFYLSLWRDHRQPATGDRDAFQLASNGTTLV